MSRSGLASACVLLLVAVAMAAAESPPVPPAPDELGTAIEALKQRNRDLERRLAELEGKIGEGADAQASRTFNLSRCGAKACPPKSLWPTGR